MRCTARFAVYSEKLSFCDPKRVPVICARKKSLAVGNQVRMGGKKITARKSEAISAAVTFMSAAPLKLRGRAA